MVTQAGSSDGPLISQPPKTKPKDGHPMVNSQEKESSPIVVNSCLFHVYLYSQVHSCCCSNWQQLLGVSENKDFDCLYASPYKYEYEEEDEKFSRWLKSISQCLSSKISDDIGVYTAAESDEEEEDIDEEVRHMNTVKSVFDEDTATNLVKNYLNFLKVNKTS